MLDIDILKTKSTTTVRGEDILDLIPSSVDVTRAIKLSDVIYIADDFDMRPDLISMYYCQDQNSMGMLLKMNNISNPFSVGNYDIFYIPNLQSLKNIKKSQTGDGSGEKERDSFRKKLKERISKVTPERKEYLNARGISDEASAPLPPNITEPGDQQFKVENGKLIFGSSIGVCRTKLSQNKSKATIKSRFAQGKIFDEL